MEDPLPMARVILEKQRNDPQEALRFAQRQYDSAKSEVLRRFWKDVLTALENDGNTLEAGYQKQAC